MEIFTDVRQAHLNGPTFLTIGTLDGMHRGHQALIQKAAELAQQVDAESPSIGAIAFAPHPRSVVRPEAAPKLLSMPKERMHEAAKVGATFGVIQSFTAGTARLRAVEFMTLVKEHLGLHTLVIGPDFALGKERSGDVDRLREIGREIDYEVVVLPPVEWNGEQIRSSRIRELLTAGSVDEAADLLGRPYSLTGLVVDGDKRGRTIGVPTANLKIDPKRQLPADGVYATRSWIKPNSEQKEDLQLACIPFDSVTNLGMRPTVNGREHRFETHLLDFPPTGETDDIYGDVLQVEFIQHLRGEVRFDGLDALVAQIQQDILQAREILSKTKK